MGTSLGSALRAQARPGQALMELAVGMLALALVLSALFSFAAYVVSSLEMQRSLRAEAGRKAMNAAGQGFATAKDSDTVELEQFAADYLFGENELKIEEEVQMPNMGVVRE